MPGSAPDYNTVVDLSLGSALVAGAGFSSWTYRVGFDVSLPVFSPLAEDIVPCEPPNSSKCTREWLAVNAQTNLHKDYNRELAAMPGLVLLRECHGEYKMRCHGNQRYRYPEVLQVCKAFVALLENFLSCYTSVTEIDTIKIYQRYESRAHSPIVFRGRRRGTVE